MKALPRGYSLLPISESYDDEEFDQYRLEAKRLLKSQQLNILRHQDYAYAIMFDGQVVAVVVTGNSGGPDGTVDVTIAVDPQHRRQGLAEYLLACVERDTRSMELGVMLEVLNEQAILPMAQKRGYQRREDLERSSSRQVWVLEARVRRWASIFTAVVLRVAVGAIPATIKDGSRTIFVELRACPKQSASIGLDQHLERAYCRNTGRECRMLQMLSADGVSIVCKGIEPKQRKDEEVRR